MFDLQHMHHGRLNGMTICEESTMQRHGRVSALRFMCMFPFHWNATKLVSHALIYGTPRAPMAGHRCALVRRRTGYTWGIPARVSARPRPITGMKERPAGRNTNSQTVFRIRSEQLCWKVEGRNASFLARSQNCEKRLLVSYPSVRMELGSQWTDFDETWYVRLFRKSVMKIQISLKYYKNNGYFTWKRFDIFYDISLNSSYNEQCFRQKL
jgi:hypothetical protein